MQKQFHAEDGTRLAYRDEGQGLPLLALAGLTRCGHDFDYLAHHLVDVRLIRLDARGRGGSDWASWQSYTVPQEAADALALLDYLGLDSAAVIGASRGGLLGMVMAASAPGRLSGLCLSDVGPELERAGLERIGAYVGMQPDVATLEELADRLPRAMPGFENVPPARWAEETVRHYVQHEGHTGLTYDPDLRRAMEAAMAAAPVDLWPLFDACAGVPLALIRGANSDVLSRGTADEMQRRRPDMIRADIADRGHVPFLDEPEAVSAIKLWLKQVADAVAPAGAQNHIPKAARDAM